MSVNQKHYVMIGIDLLPKVGKMNEDELDIFLEQMEELAESTELTFIYDGMSGEYCFIGHVLNEGAEDDGMSPKIHRFSSILKYTYQEVAEKLSITLLNNQPSLISFTHWY